MPPSFNDRFSIKFPSRKISLGVKLCMAASRNLELSSETSTFTDAGLWIAIPLFVMHPNVNVFSTSGFSRSIVKETESLSVHEHHSKSEYFKLPRIPFVRSFSVGLVVNTGLAVAKFHRTGSINVFPICLPCVKVALFKVSASFTSTIFS